MTMAAELLDAAVQRELQQLDEKLYLEVFAVPNKNLRPGARAAAELVPLKEALESHLSWRQLRLDGWNLVR